MANNVIKEMGVTKGVRGMEAKAYVIDFDKFCKIPKDLSEPNAPLDTKDKAKSKPGDQDIKSMEKSTKSLSEAVLPEGIPFDPKAAEAALGDIIKSKDTSELQDIINAIAGGNEEDYDQIQNIIIAIKQDQKELPEVASSVEEFSSTHYKNGVAKFLFEDNNPSLALEQLKHINRQLVATYQDKDPERQKLINQMAIDLKIDEDTKNYMLDETKYRDNDTTEDTNVIDNIVNYLNNKGVKINLQQK